MRYNNTMFSTLDLLVLTTIAYTDQFNFPLSSREVFRRLVSLTALRFLGVKRTTKRQLKIAPALITKTLTKLVKHGKLQLSGSWYGLSSKSTAIFQTRRQRHRHASTRLKEIEQLGQSLAQIPWVEAAAITGSAAMANAAETADLDILVITTSQRLWLTRILVLFLTIWFQKRGSAGWCFNLWLEPTELALPSQKQGIYEAYELWQCQWFFDRANWQKAWLEQNAWSRQFLPFMTSQSLHSVLRPTANHVKTTSQLDQLNGFCYWLQAKYRSWRYQEAWPLKHQVFFHDPQARSQIYRRWQRRLGELGISRPVVGPRLMIKSQVGKKSQTAWQLPPKIAALVKASHLAGQKIVLVTGVFDVLHGAHRNFLELAKAQGKVLLVGLESDVRVSQIKGQDRPINNQEIRLARLENWELADGVFILPEQFSLPLEHERVIAMIRPAILAVSSHTEHLEQKTRILQKYRGQVKVVFNQDPTTSTTQLLKTQK